MTRAMLIDLTRCIGCRGCQAACKQWHDLPGETTHNTGSNQNPPWISGKTRTMVTFNEVEQNGQLDWVFAKRQCMHCEHPGCASACTVGALRKTADGPVVYDASKCIGCRYCQYACPFDVPAYEWDEVLGLIGKCDFCVDRLAEGMEPACVKACPTEAITFGERDELLAEARPAHHRQFEHLRQPHLRRARGGRHVDALSVRRSLRCFGLPESGQSASVGLYRAGHGKDAGYRSGSGCRSQRVCTGSSGDDS